MVRMPQFLHAVDWLIINRDESETYLNMSIRNISDMQRAAEKWVELGVSNVIITNGLEPLIFKNCHTEHIVPISPAQHFVDATGAGDSFTSAVIYSWLNDFSLQDIIKSGMVNSLKRLKQIIPYVKTLIMNNLNVIWRNIIMKQYLEFSSEVAEAKKHNQPIVALESTIISHGMPYPQNIEMAKM